MAAALCLIALALAVVALLPARLPAPLVARVTAIQRQPEGWFTHCEWLERMPEEDLHSLLTPDRVAL